MSSIQAATVRLAEVAQGRAGAWEKGVVERIQSALPRLSATNVLIVLELASELVEETREALRTPNVKIAPDGAMIPMETETYGNGTVSVDANGDIAEVEFTVPVEVVR